MNIKSIIKVLQLKSLFFIMLAPLSIGAVASFYKFDLINIPLFLYTACIIFLASIATNAFHILSLYKHRWFSELELIKGIKEQIPFNTIRTIGISSLILTGLLLMILVQWTTLSVIFPLVIALCLFILFSIGPKPLWQTPLNEVIFSFSIGYLLTSFTTYTQVYFEVTNIFSFYLLMLWVSLPLILALACFQFVYNQKLSQYDNKLLTMSNIMGYQGTFFVMEIATILACVLPCLAIYLNYIPWTISLIWIMYPKMVINLRKYEKSTNIDQKMSYIQQNAMIIVVYQVLLTVFGIFF